MTLEEIILRDRYQDLLFETERVALQILRLRDKQRAMEEANDNES